MGAPVPSVIHASTRSLMPELPDAVVYERRIANGALDREISGTTVVDPLILEDGIEPHRLAEVLEGQQLTGTHRHGKHVFARYGTDTGWLALHFGMTGSVRIVGDDKLPEYAYVQFHFADADPEALDPECFMLPHCYGDERCPDTDVPLQTE